MVYELVVHVLCSFARRCKRGSDVTHAASSVGTEVGKKFLGEGSELRACGSINTPALLANRVELVGAVRRLLQSQTFPDTSLHLLCFQLPIRHSTVAITDVSCCLSSEHEPHDFPKDNAESPDITGLREDALI